MNLRIYLDDCAYDKDLVKPLRLAGYEVVTPFDAGIAGQTDAVHFAYAKSKGLILLTKNPRDFEELHTCYPGHPGIFAVYQDNDPTKDMAVADIARAIKIWLMQASRLLVSSIPSMPGGIDPLVYHIPLTLSKLFHTDYL